jgi:hypothetical protein
VAVRANAEVLTIREAAAIRRDRFKGFMDKAV